MNDKIERRILVWKTEYGDDRPNTHDDSGHHKDEIDDCAFLFVA